MAKGLEKHESDNGLLWGTLNPFGSRYETTIKDNDTGRTYHGSSEESQDKASERAEENYRINQRNNR